MPSLLERLREALSPDYTVEREIASGGMGTVFLGRDERLLRPIAIKILRQELATAVTVERFVHEAQHLAGLNHPNILGVHDAGEKDGLVYYIMDYVDGETLDKRIARGRLTLAETVSVGRALLGALELAHRKGIIHRDIKPSNIFLVGGRALLADFGIAYSVHQSTAALTLPGQLVGTLAYMAPEQLRGEAATTRTDLYAVGLVLFEACTGRRWDTQTASDQASWAGVPFRLQPPLEKALEPLPQNRWPDARSFSRALAGAPAWVRGPIAALSLAALTALFGWSIWRVLSSETKSQSDVAVYPFEAVGIADSALGDHLSRLTASYLEAMPGIKVAPVRTTFQEWRASPLPPAERMARLSSAVGAKYAVWGVVRPSRAGLEVQLYCLDAGGRTRLETLVRGDSGDQMGLADTIRLRIISTVSPHSKQLSRNLGGLAGVDPRAVPEFLFGEADSDRDAWLSAEKHYLKALAIDSTFVLAAWRLANARRWMPLRPEPPLPAGFLSLYRSHGGSLPALDRLLIEAQFATGGEERLALYRKAVRQAPHDAYAALYYGDEVFHRGPLSGQSRDTAIVILRRAVELDPSLAPAHEHLAWALIRSGRREEARRSLIALHQAAGRPEESEIYLPRFLELAYAARFAPDSASLNDPVLHSAFGLGVAARGAFSMDIPEVGAVLGARLAALPSVPPALHGSGEIAQGLAQMTLGRPSVALAHFDSAVPLLPDPKEARHQAAEWRVIPSALGLPGIPDAEIERGRRELMRLMDDNSRRVRAGWALALEALTRGDTAGAAPWIQSVASGSAAASPFHHLLQAMRQAAAGRPDAALRLSQSALAYDSAGRAGDPFFRAALHLQRGDWFEKRNQPDSADASWLWYENLDVVGWPSTVAQAGEVDWPLGTMARLRRSRLAARRGNTGKACDLVTEAMQSWTRTEPSFEPLVAEARSLKRRCRK
jgi:serine/threonine protein kinase/tetratricopeptide (TPR) repeat protein